MIKKLLLVFTIMLLVTGCGKVEKFYLEDESYGEYAITDISLKEFEKLEKDKENFAIFVYLPACTSCAEFRGVLEKFLKEEKMNFYSISIKEVKETSIDEVVDYAPALVLYKEGKVVDYLDSTSDEDKPYFKNAKDLKVWLEEYIYLNKEDSK